MKDWDKEKAYQEYISMKPICPRCGGVMVYTGGLLPWVCSKCDVEADLFWDQVNQEYLVEIPGEPDWDEFWDDPIGNMPECCKACGGPFPSCMTSCKIFDN